MSLPENFLQICQRTRQEAGLPGTGPDTVVGLSSSSDMGRVVDWCGNAYNDICNAHLTWRFLRDVFSFSTVATQQEYTPTEAGAPTLATWITEHRDETGAVRVFRVASDESRLQFLPWDEFHEIYDFGSNRIQTERPSVVTVNPSNNLVLWAVPNIVYNINGEYYKVAPALTLDADTPLFPARFYMMVVWKALIDYAGWTAADEKYAHGQSRYKGMLRKLEMDQLEKILHGPPLA